MAKLVVNLFYMSSRAIGGEVTFATHLYKGLKALGVYVRLFKIEPSSSKDLRGSSFGYMTQHQKISIENALKQVSYGHNLIVALDNSGFYNAAFLLKCGADLITWNNFPRSLDKIIKHFNPRLLVTSRSELKTYKNSWFLPLPYNRVLKDLMSEILPLNKREFNAISINRVNKDRNTEMILATNLLLDLKYRIQIFGYIDKLFKKTLKESYPQFNASEISFNLESHIAPYLSSKAKYLCDFSEGRRRGHPKYTVLEGLDANCIPILHDDWITPNGEMIPGENCFTVSDPGELAAVLQARVPTSLIKEIQAGGKSLLERHNARSVAKKLVEFLEGDDDALEH